MQKLGVIGDKVVVMYFKGYLCGGNKIVFFVIELICIKMVGRFVFKRFDIDSCIYYFSWDFWVVCVVKFQEVQMVNGIIINFINGKSFSFGDIYFKLFRVFGDMRINGDNYLYEI